MIALIILLIPSVVLVYLREKRIGLETTESAKTVILQYVVSVLVVNGIIMIVLYLGFHFTGNLFQRLNEDNLFACKYLVLAFVIAIIEPNIERFIRNRVHIDWSGVHSLKKFSHWKIVATIYSVILFLLNLIRIFDNNLWGDEAFTANLVTNNISTIISQTAADVHPPLYYMFVKLGYFFVGNQGWMLHLVSLIPCGIIIIFALTVFWRKFGGVSAIILITLATLSQNAVIYNVEVRMYSWGALFVLFSFYCLYLILQDEKIYHYIGFVVFSLAAAYTHYYCFVAVALFYVVILVLAIFRKRLSLIKVLLASIVSVVGYLPWASYLVNSVFNTSESFWITSIPTFRESIAYLFSSQFHIIIWVCIFIGLVFFFMYETGFLVVCNEERKYNILVAPKKLKLSNDAIWMIVGLICIVGTISFGIAISHLVRPFYILRYIYPVSILAWCLLGFGISKLKLKKIYFVILLVYMLVIFLPAYSETYRTEKSTNDTLQETLAATKDYIQTDDVILTDIGHVNWTISKYYYPDVPTELVELSEFPTLDDDMCYWLIVNESDEMDGVFEQIESQGFTWDQVVDDGNLGTVAVKIYQLVYSDMNK